MIERMNRNCIPDKVLNVAKALNTVARAPSMVQLECLFERRLRFWEILVLENHSAQLPKSGMPLHPSAAKSLAVLSSISAAWIVFTSTPL